MWFLSGSKYPVWVLHCYDAWLMNIANPYIWCCSTRDVLTPFVQRHKGLNHCDVGVGTGYHLINCKYSPTSSVTLVDIELDPLDFATTRMRGAHPDVDIRISRHDILSSESLADDQKFDSISLMYLLHCIPSSTAEKVQIFHKLSQSIDPDGVVFGATILGRGRWHSWPARVLLIFLNWEKRLSNYEDRPDELESAMKAAFSQVKIQVVGSILLFEARKPIKQS